MNFFNAGVFFTPIVFILGKKCMGTQEASGHEFWYIFYLFWKKNVFKQ